MKIDESFTFFVFKVNYVVFILRNLSLTEIQVDYISHPNDVSIFVGYTFLKDDLNKDGKLLMYSNSFEEALENVAVEVL